MIMHLFKSALPLAFFAASALAQTTFLTLPATGSTLTVGSNFTVQLGMPGYPENIDIVATVIGLAPCYGGECYPSSSYMGDILYQGQYVPQPTHINYYENFTVTVPNDFPTGNATLNAINFFMVGASFEPVVDYLNNDVIIVAQG